VPDISLCSMIYMLLQPLFVVPRVELTQHLEDRDRGFNSSHNVMIRCFCEGIILKCIPKYIIFYKSHKLRELYGKDGSRSRNNKHLHFDFNINKYLLIVMA
jgi:hypothetical protein